MSKPFYSYPYSTWSIILTPTWFTHLWTLFNLCYTTITITDHWTYIPPRLRNMHLMDFLFPHIPSPDVHYCLNACRIALRIITLVDMVTLDGTHIPPTFFMASNFVPVLINGLFRKFPHHGGPHGPTIFLHTLHRIFPHTHMVNGTLLHINSGIDAVFPIQSLYLLTPQSLPQQLLPAIPYSIPQMQFLC